MWVIPTLRYEYIEVKNVSTSPLNLEGFRIGGGVEFTFPSIVLAGGKTAVVVADVTGFRAGYGQNILIAGQYTNRLNNAGENISRWRGRLGYRC